MIRIEDNDTPIIAAKNIIHGTKTVEMTPARAIGAIIATGKAPEKSETIEVDMFDNDEIREIADYLLTYCKHHQGE